MKTLQDLKNNIDKLLEKHPEYANLPIIYSSDDEGNSYQKIDNELSPMEVDDITERNPEPTWFDEDHPGPRNVNCICIN